MPETKPLTAEQEKELREAAQTSGSVDGELHTHPADVAAALATIDQLRAELEKQCHIARTNVEEYIVAGKAADELQQQVDTLTAENTRLTKLLAGDMRKDELTKACVDYEAENARLRDLIRQMDKERLQGSVFIENARLRERLEAAEKALRWYADGSRRGEFKVIDASDGQALCDFADFADKASTYFSKYAATKKGKTS